MPGASRPRSRTRTIGARHDANAAASSAVGSNHSSRRGEVGHHHRERLVRPPLPLTEQSHGLRIGRITRQVEAAEPLDRHDRPASKHRADELDDIAFDTAARRVAELDPRTARRTRHGLRVEAPIAGSLVLLPAGLAHREVAHRRSRPVVREGLDDRESRTAVGAVDERVPVPAIVRVEELAQARVAGGGVGRDEPIAGGAFDADVDVEPGEPVDVLGRPADVVHHGERRRGARRAPPRTHRATGRRPFQVDLDHTVGVADPARQAVPLRQPPDERPEPHALHDAADRDPAGLRLGRHDPAHVPPPASRTIASTSAGSAASTAGDRPRPARTSPTSTPRNTTRGTGPSAAARPTASARPSPCDESEDRRVAGSPSGPDSARTTAPGSRAAVRRPHRVHQHHGPGAVQQVEDVQRGRRRHHLDVGRNERSRPVHRHEPGRVVAGVGVPAADDPDARHAGLRRARRRPAGNGSRTRCRGRSSARPSRTGA